MHPITFQQKPHLPRSPHGNLSHTWQLEAVIPVPVHGHPQAEHFRLCGVTTQEEPLSAADIETLNEAAKRVEVKDAGDGFFVVVDGKYVAGQFKLHLDYSEAASGELRAAESATRTVLKLSAGHQPADMGLQRLEKA